MDYASMPLLNPPVVSSNIQQHPTLLSLYADQHKKPETSKLKKSGALLRIAVYATLGYLLLSQKFTYNIVNQIYATFSKNHTILVNEEGPTVAGIITHTALFFVLMLLLLFTSK